MWSLATDEASARTDSNLPYMYAPLIKNGVQHSFSLLKKHCAVVSEPVRKRALIKIPGADGDIDLLENMLEKPIYERRKITETFMLMRYNAEHGIMFPSANAEWSAIISELKNFFNAYIGQIRIVLSEDKSYYYKGRISAAVVAPEAHRAFVKITADVEPYKYERYRSDQPWIWDDFSFVDGIIRDYSDIEISYAQGNDYMTFDIPVRNCDIQPLFRANSTVEAESDIKVSIDATTWYDAGFSSYTPINGITLAGSRIKNTVRHLYIKGNGHRIGIRVQGKTL